MKCKIFIGLYFEAQNQFNAWAKGRALSKYVIIHEQILPINDTFADARLLIIVYYPEDDVWDKTQTEPIPAVQPKPIDFARVEREVMTQ
jgi:hypothetical protein